MEEFSYTTMVDLSMAIHPRMRLWPGTQEPEMRWIARYEEAGYNLSDLRIGLHTGTHVDAPLHWMREGRSIDSVPLTSLAGRGRLFRRDRVPAGEGETLTLEEVERSGFSVSPGDIFIADCRTEEIGDDSDYFSLFPIPSPELLVWLRERGIRAYMTDAPAVDRLGDLKSLNHKLLLEGGIPIVENLVRLSLLPENTSVFVSAFPLKLAGREGAPCRAVAFLKE